MNRAHSKSFREGARPIGPAMCDYMKSPGRLSRALKRRPGSQVSPARITQILNLLHLAPEIQEEILFLPPVSKGRDRIHLESLQALTALLDWQSQRRWWKEMQGTRR